MAGAFILICDLDVERLVLRCHGDICHIMYICNIYYIHTHIIFFFVVHMQMRMYMPDNTHKHTHKHTHTHTHTRTHSAHLFVVAVFRLKLLQSYDCVYLEYTSTDAHGMHVAGFL